MKIVWHMSPEETARFHAKQAALEENRAIERRRLRDQFAGQALAGLCANPGGPFQHSELKAWGIVNCDEDAIAAQCFRLADAMIEERDRD